MDMKDSPLVLTPRSNIKHIVKVDPNIASAHNKQYGNSVQSFKYCPSMNCNFKTMVNAELDNHKLIHKVKKKREKTALKIEKTRIVEMKIENIEIVHEVKKAQEYYACHHCFLCFKYKKKLAKHISLKHLNSLETRPTRSFICKD
jgi:hypothetical protein